MKTKDLGNELVIDRGFLCFCLNRIFRATVEQRTCLSSDWFCWSTALETLISQVALLLLLSCSGDRTKGDTIQFDPIPPRCLSTQTLNAGAIKLVDAVGCRFLWRFFYDFITQPLLFCFKSVWLCVCAGMSGRFLRQYFQINNINRDLLIKFLLCRSGIGKLYRFCPLIGPPSLGFGFRLGSTRISFWRHTCESFLLQIG